MELNLNSQLIKSRRLERAWSQEHLAHVCGLGVRTIQRIETTGQASYESVQALAATLDLPVRDLIGEALPEDRQTQGISLQKRKIALLASIILVAISFLVARTVVADQVMLDVGITVNEENQLASKVLANTGEEVLIQVDDQYRLLISPTLESNGDVSLAISLLKSNGVDYVQIAQPRVITPDREAAVIRSSSEGGDSIYIRITPDVQ